LPTRREVHRRHMNLNEDCEFCNAESESWSHDLIKCHFSKGAWKLGLLPWDVIIHVLDDPLAWLIYYIENLSTENFVMTLTTAWAIWFARNEATHSNTILDPLRTHRFIDSYNAAYVEAFRSLQHTAIHHHVEEQNWTRPDTDFVKLNFDSGLTTSKGTGFGGIIRDAQGTCIAWFAFNNPHRLDPEHGELMAATFVMELALDLGYKKMVLEGDCLSIINALKSKQNMEVSPLGNVFADIFSLIDQCDEFRPEHVRRDRNKTAHQLAKHGTYQTFGFDFQSLP
ncbi:hypothetical protein M569_05963, partial [Genlisea aurea]